VLAAGAGRRLAPLSRLRPKALCPVGSVALVDHALARLASVTPTLSVNVHHGRASVEAHFAGAPGIHLSVEEPEALGTAGALGALRPWIDGRAVLVTNADAWLAAAGREGDDGQTEPVDLRPLLDGWDGERMRLLTVADPRRGDFGPARYCGAALLPWAEVRDLAATPAGLYEARWGRAWAEGRLELIDHDGAFVDCGTPADYLAANLQASGGSSVVGPGAVVGAGATVERSVVWPGAVVWPGERLVDAIRAEDLTVLVR